MSKPNFDPAGTAPGLAPKAKQEDQTVNMSCRRRGCDSMLAYEIKLPQEGARMYRCAQCNHTFGVRTGGSINL